MKPFLRRDVKSVFICVSNHRIFVEIAFLCFANLNGKEVLSNSLTALVYLLSAISIGFALQKERK